MNGITIMELKKELIDAIKGIDKSRITALEIKELSEALSVLSTVRENQPDYIDALINFSSARFGCKPTTDEKEGK